MLDPRLDRGWRVKIVCYLYLVSWSLVIPCQINSIKVNVIMEIGEIE